MGPHSQTTLRFQCLVPILALALLIIGAEAQSAVKSSLTEINPPKAAPDRKVVAIRGATLIDGRGGPPLTNAVVVARGATIAAAGQSSDIKVPTDASIIDASGLLLLPGFLDSHFHIERDYEMPRLVLSHGVTSARDPGQWIHIYDPIRKSAMLQPRCFVAGPHLDCPPPAYPADSFLVTNLVDVTSAVNRFIDDGASVIKCYYRLPQDFIAAACTTAHKRGVPVTAHLELVDARDAIAAGLDGVEHVTSFGTALAEPADAAAFCAAVREENEARRKERYRL